MKGHCCVCMCVGCQQGATGAFGPQPDGSRGLIVVRRRRIRRRRRARRARVGS